MNHKKNRNICFANAIKLRNKIISKKVIDDSTKMIKTESRKIGKLSKKLKSQNRIIPNADKDNPNSQSSLIRNSSKIKCTVCSELIPRNEKENSMSFIEHPFFINHKMCSKHEHTTRKCVACHRLEPYNQKYSTLFFMKATIKKELQDIP